jgi:hypothetical protein
MSYIWFAKRALEKRSYDYDHEVHQSERRAKVRQHDNPVSWAPLLIGGGMLGAGIGGLKTLGRSPAAVASGIGLGALGGLALGGVAGLVDRADISDAKHVSALPPAERRRFLAARARGSERAAAESAAERRHKELLSKVGGTKQAVLRPGLAALRKGRKHVYPQADRAIGLFPRGPGPKNPMKGSVGTIKKIVQRGSKADAEGNTVQRLNRVSNLRGGRLARRARESWGSALESAWKREGTG